MGMFNREMTPLRATLMVIGAIGGFIIGVIEVMQEEAEEEKTPQAEYTPVIIDPNPPRSGWQMPEIRTPEIRTPAPPDYYTNRPTVNHPSPINVQDHLRSRPDIPATTYVVPSVPSVPRPQTPAEITGRTGPGGSGHTATPGGAHEAAPSEAQHETPRDLALIFSPRPLMEEIENYQRWELSTDEHEQYLGDAVEVGAFSVRPMGEFILKGSNSRRAAWDVRGGLPGVGLDLVVEALQPADATLTSPVVEDGESVQVFRFGRREQRIRNGAEISYQEVNGLMVWRVLVPANQGSKLATCYYAAIADEKMIVLTARYNPERPEQMIGFDTIARTITMTE